MDRLIAEKRIEELKAILWENSRRYYVDNAPVISDFEYDHLMYELEELEKLFPEFASADSPTRKVGSDLETGNWGQNAEPSIRHEFNHVAHRYPMLSLANTYSLQELEAFAQRSEKNLGHGFTYCCELKFDGTAICLEYRKGRLFRALTRGDGTIGDDVTENVRHIANIPHTLTGTFPDEFEIRGEILMPYEAFDRLNREKIDNEEPPFANPRNAASGSLKLLDPTEVGHRGLYCTLYHIPSESLSFESHDEALASAKSWGLPVSDERCICHNISEIEEYINKWDIKRKSLPFATDGIVVKINEMAAQKELGFTAKSPRWAVAYKFQAEKALTKVLSIDYQVGRTGAVTPVANLQAVQLSGTVVKRATLNNSEQMSLLDIRIGDSVYVEKGGEIIPKITSVDLSLRPADAQKPVFPATCPDCGTALVREDGEAKWFCPNSDGCPTQIQGRLLHFLSRKAMNVLAGEATIQQLFNLGLVRDVADFYDLRMTQLLMLEGWKEKSASRFMESLSQSRNVPFERVLFALGIRYVGESTAKELAKHYGDIEAIMSASLEDLLEVADVGEVIANSVYSYFRFPEHIETVNRLKSHGLRFSIQEQNRSSDALAGMTIVISGNFSVSRDKIKEMIEQNGGKNSSSISSRTSFLLAGTKPGPEKIKKCQEAGISIIDEDAFRALLPSETRQEPEELTLF